MIKNITVPFEFKSSVCNEHTNCPAWKVEAFLFGEQIVEAMYEGKDSTERKAQIMCESKVREYIKCN
tara:strand:+ start:548 stop:748 length:201 start_codon:yes stop_codon:yes gene_type:complete